MCNWAYVCNACAHFPATSSHNSCNDNVDEVFRLDRCKSVFSIKNADTSEQKSNFLKIFNLLSQIELRAMSDEKRLYFRIKRAGSSNYRGAAFSPLAKIGQLFTCL